MSTVSYRMSYAVVAFGLLTATAASAAQVVVMAPKGIPQPDANIVAQVLASELSRYDGFSAISSMEIRSLLEHEADRQALGCQETGCMRGVAEAMGAELLLVSNKAKNALQMSLVSVGAGTVLARATSALTSNATLVKLDEAVASMVQVSLPADSRGPGWMSKRGFKAVVLGFLSQAVGNGQATGNLGKSRRRIVTDLIRTSLDVDVAPKLKLLRRAIKKERKNLNRQIIGAPDAKSLRHLLKASGWFDELEADASRAEEVRARAREKGTPASMGLMRFADPEPPEMPDEDDVDDHRRKSSDAISVVDSAVRALSSANIKGFSGGWVKKRRADGITLFGKLHKQSERGKLFCGVLPPELMQLDQLETVEAAPSNQRIVLVRCKNGDTWHPLHRATLEKDGDSWRIAAWADGRD